MSKRQPSLGWRSATSSPGRLNAGYKEPYVSEEAVRLAKSKERGKSKGEERMKEVIQEEDEFDEFDDEVLASVNVDF
jgi:hypothetical protein